MVWRGVGLFPRMLGMLLALVLLVQLANAALLLMVRPPRPEMYRLDEIVRVLKGDRSPSALAGLKVSVRSRPAVGLLPTPSTARGRPNLERMIAEALGARLSLPVDHIQVESARGRGLFELGGGPPRMMGPRPRDERRDHALFDKGPSPGVPSGEPGAGASGMGPPPGPAAFGLRLFANPPVLGPFRISVMQADGRWAVVESRESFPTPWQQRLILLLAVSAALCVPVALFYARWMAEPFARFADAADRLGGDPGGAELEVAGPAEVRKAGEAFNRMQDRLRRYIENRTTLVGAVAHDLRTPLARMRFLLETPGDDVRARLGREIDEMDAMVAATMAFVRDSTVKAVRADLDLGSLLESLADDASEEGGNVSIGETPTAIVHGDPVGLRRLFDNLIRNGLKFATEVRVTLSTTVDEVVVDVADNGPGLPASDLERVFEPFYRGEASRNRETGGMGLGLAVVRSIARAHGGEAIMINRPEGGLTCRVRLPLRPTPQRPS